MEFRCVECGWLDPKVWTNQDVCNCKHYFEVTIIDTNPRAIQMIFWANGKVGEDDA